MNKRNNKKIGRIKDFSIQSDKLRKKNHLEQINIEQLKQIQIRSDSFINSNKKMFDYLRKIFGDLSFLNLVYTIIKEILIKYPSLSLEQIADCLSSKFGFNDKALFTQNLKQYVSEEIIHNFHKNIQPEKIKHSIDEKSLIELAEYLSCLIYYKLKSFEGCTSEFRYKFQKKYNRNAADFYPIALNKFALNRSMWFKGRVESTFFDETKNGYWYANLFIIDENSYSFRAYINPVVLANSYNEATKLKQNNLDIYIHGKVVFNNYLGKIIIDADSIAID